MLRAQPEATGSQTPPAWQPVGPLQVSTSAWNLVTGPVNSIAADPSDSSGNTVFVGTAGGGVWKSTNAAGSPASASFSPLTDNLSAFSSASLASLSIGAVSVQPGGTGVVLAGTGDPNNATDSWYGVGLLRSADGGNTWSLISYTALSLSPADLQFNFIGNAFAGFAWSATAPNFVVAAVSQSSYGEILSAANNQAPPGLYYSPDAGVSWELATIEDGSTVLQSDQFATQAGNAATAVIWNPVRQRFYAAIRYHGYYESLDGITWTRLANQPGVNLTTTLCPSNPGQRGSPACPIFRGTLAVQPVTGDMFALTVDQNNIDQGLWQDVCAIASGSCSSGTVQFGTRISDTALDSIAGDGSIPQAGYSLWLSAIPSQQDTLLFAGTTDIWRCSMANSCTWRNTTNTQTCAAAQVAPLQHAVDSTFAAGGLLYFGNDAGLWRTTDAVNQQQSACSTDDAAHFQNLNSALGSLSQVENFAQDPNTATTWLAALGDLGTAAPGSSPTIWNQVLGGEGNVVAIDPANPGNWYATSEFGVGINACSGGTSCDAAAFGNVVIGEAQVDNDLQIIPAPWILDPADTANLILGTCRVWRGPANGAGWSQSNLLSTMLDGDQGTFCNGNAEIRSLAAAPPASGSEQLYAGMAGALDGGALIPGHVFTASVTAAQTTPATWTDRYSSPVTGGSSTQFNPSGYDISSIYPDPHDVTGQTLYVTVQGVSNLLVAQPLVYRSTDAGAHWINITANLPLAPANSVLVDPNSANIVYVALDTGVYVTQNVSACTGSGAACWNVYGTGLPNAPVISLMSYNQGATQALRAATWGRGIWQVGLATSGITSTTATIAPASLSFAAQQVQTVSAAQPITITNTGTLNLNITGVSIAGDFFETDNCSGQSIAVQTACAIQVSFAPTQTGSRSGSLTVFANVAGGQLTATLSGTGLAGANVILSPDLVTFPATTVGTKSAAQIVSIANVGGEPVTLTSETLTGDYIFTGNTCGNTLAVQTSCTVTILFAPTASGTRPGALTVVDSLGTQTAQLTGTGQSMATDSLSPVSLTFAPQQVGTTSAAQQVTLSNSGDLPLTGIAVTVSGDFTAGNNCGTLLQGHGSCSLAVAYVPTRPGSEPGSLVVSDEYHSQVVSLSGTGVAPPGVSVAPNAVNFGGYAVGTTSNAQAVTVTNNGGYPLASLTAAITSGFAIVTNACPSTLGVGASCQIGMTFSASAAGAVTGVLTVSAANLANPFHVTLSGAGEDFSIADSGSSSAVVTSGQTATFILELAGLSGSTGTVALACSGAPQNATCSLNPSSSTISGANSSSVTVTIATGVSTSSALRPFSLRNVIPALVLALPLYCAGIRRKRSLGLVLLIAAALLLQTGCGVAASGGSGTGGGTGGSGGGGGSGSQNQTPSGTYVLTVAGTMSNISHSVTLNLTVQ